ncbi:hypothetical protein BY996DRAFT_6508724 [Phakopsora pachyrhizi]|nr:hypothetical protein BY996DRAFT_6508724 [Phakopsora pachyrhizi]
MRTVKNLDSQTAPLMSQVTFEKLRSLPPPSILLRPRKTIPNLGSLETPTNLFGKGGQEKGGAERGFYWILQDFEEEGVAEQKLGGGAHQGQSGWSETTGATDL